MRFVIAAGGTGGHLFPGLAVGEVLHARQHEVMVLISEKKIDALATEARTEFRFEKLPAMGMPRLFSPAIFGFLARFKASLDRCRALYNDFMPHAVLGMGGFTSTAPILAGRRRKLPTFVHESNAIPGKANRLNARMVTAVLLGFKECLPHFARARCEVTGTPIREALIERIEKSRALASFGFTMERKTLLIMGGSQGARGLNRALIAALPALHGVPVQAVHLAGNEDEQSVRDAYAAARIPAVVASFHHRMQEAYGAADLCIARAGAASLTELSHFALPSVLIPYPYAAEDHQTLNARIFERAGAAVLFKESELTGEILARKLRCLLEDSGCLSEMSRCCAALARPDAAEYVVETMLKFCAP